MATFNGKWLGKYSLHGAFGYVNRNGLTYDGFVFSSFLKKHEPIP